MAHFHPITLSHKSSYTKNKGTLQMYVRFLYSLCINPIYSECIVMFFPNAFAKYKGNFPTRILFVCCWRRTHTSIGAANPAVTLDICVLQGTLASTGAETILIVTKLATLLHHSIGKISARAWLTGKSKTWDSDLSNSSVHFENCYRIRGSRMEMSGRKNNVCILRKIRRPFPILPMSCQKSKVPFITMALTQWCWFTSPASHDISLAKTVLIILVTHNYVTNSCITFISLNRKIEPWQRKRKQE